jgi:LysM repeat protein
MSTDQRNLFPQDPQCPSGSVSYVIRPGDTFYTIAQRLRTTVAAITALNPGVNPNQLQVGQSICVPAAGPGPSPGSCPGGTLYTIQAGDTFYALASRFGVTLQALIAANPGVDPNRLVIGQQICIPGVVQPQPPAVIPTPLCSLLRPVTSALPSTADIPIGSVTIRQIAMSTRAYTVVASPLPEPAALGSYNTYIGVLNLITDDPANPRTTEDVRLEMSIFGNQLPTWAGTVVSTYPPIVGDVVEFRPFNSTTNARGPVVLRGDIAACQTR